MSEVMGDSVSVRFKKARVEKMPLNIRVQWNAGTACVSECVLENASAPGFACRPLLICQDKVNKEFP